MSIYFISAEMGLRWSFYKLKAVTFMPHNWSKTVHVFGVECRAALIISAPRISHSVSLPDSLIVGNSTICFSQSAKYLGVTLDMHLTMTAHLVNRMQTADFELCHINSLGHSLSLFRPQKLLFLLLFSHDWTIPIPFFPDALSTF